MSLAIIDDRCIEVYESYNFYSLYLFRHGLSVPFSAPVYTTNYEMVALEGYGRSHLLFR